MLTSRAGNARCACWWCLPSSAVSTLSRRFPTISRPVFLFIKFEVEGWSMIAIIAFLRHFCLRGQLRNDPCFFPKLQGRESKSECKQRPGLQRLLALRSGTVAFSLLDWQVRLQCTQRRGNLPTAFISEGR